MPPLETSTSTPQSTTFSPKPAPKPSSKPKAPPVPQKSTHQQFPPCPTPDYDTLSISSSLSNNTLTRKVTNGFANHPYNEQVDMESLESFKLNNPMNHSPKPPSTYFNNRQGSNPSSGNSSQNSTLTKKSRPVSVTIGEYPSGANRKMPSKFNFLGNGSDSEHSCDSEKEPITSRLASELALTLSRSNLKKRTESMVSCIALVLYHL